MTQATRKVYPSPQDCNFTRGRAVADGEYFAGDSPRYTFRVAMTTVNRDGTEGKADFIPFVAWGWVAEALNERGGVKKGQKLSVINTRYQRYEGEDGATRASFTIYHPDDVLTPVGTTAPRLQSREVPVAEPAGKAPRKMVVEEDDLPF